MDLDALLERTLLLDLETDHDGRLLALGAQLASDTLQRRHPFDRAASLAALEALAKRAEYLLGHNLLDHDLPILHGLGATPRLLERPVIDTLFLSPLAFPENPYHHLIKDYKLVRDHRNDPLLDARLAARVFRDQWQAFAEQEAHHPGLLALYRWCFSADPRYRGIVEVFSALGAAPLDDTEAIVRWQALIADRTCTTAADKLARSLLTTPERRPPLAYTLAWLRVAGGDSVLPAWVRHTFKEVPRQLRRLRDRPCGDPACRYCRETHDPAGQLERFFGFPAFRPLPAAADGSSLQQAIVTAGMRDQPLFAILPTGGGKSLCYQLPALVRYLRRGVLTIVISPLQALMKDQVENLARNSGSINAAALSGMLTPPERSEVLERVRLGTVALLYVAPEQLRNTSFINAIKQREIGAWVFDEAHCLSKWGHDFRPDYLYAARFIKEHASESGEPLPPVQCFTATAKQEVKGEILEHFQRELGQSLEVFAGGVDRDNLTFEVQLTRAAEKQPRIDELLREGLAEAGAAVVYCASRAATEETATFLRGRGWSAECFHAGLEVPRKRQIQDAFVAGELRVICATNAFGMGIDKEDVRLVIHADIPGSLENYLQEAGRAGRDRRAARCILLYEERDIEQQFKLGALSELSRHDLYLLLRAIRKVAKKFKKEEVALTPGELLRQDDLEVSFERDDRQADTKVKTAVAWLERAGYLERNRNRTQVFQGRPKVPDLAEAERRMERLVENPIQRARWHAILVRLFNADPDEGFSADELAEHTSFRRHDGDRPSETEAQRVLRTLQDMAAQGLIEEGMRLTAFVRHKIANASSQLLEQVCRLEKAMLQLLPEEAPDAADEKGQQLSLRRLNQRLLDDGHDSNPETLRLLLASLSHDGKGLAGRQGSIVLRHVSRDHYSIRLQRSWHDLVTTAERRHQIAQSVLNALLARIPPGAEKGATVHVDFSLSDLLQALREDLLLADQLRDPLAAVDRGLMFLHEQRVITLQQGLAVFRQAMTLRLNPEAARRRYSRGDYQPLAHHYQERTFQVHVMNEYAQLALRKIGQALNLVSAYFTLEKGEFIRRFFAHQKEMLARATSQASYHEIVEALGNPAQQAIVTAPRERNLLVLAGPGSGKTRVVVHRCAYLLRVERVPPTAIILLCYNRDAATQLRRRLRGLVGDDALGVTIQTFHGLALRLTGHSFATTAERSGERIDFDALLDEALQLLRGERELPGLERDELRERLLAGYRHILVDEYQDIDQRQYDLISALAGRTERDGDDKLAILAVGDDDQNIYAFRHTNVAFIRRFQAEYEAECHYLVENFRSSGHIIDAANALIARNGDRMKGDHPIVIDRRRRDAPPGGAWEERDPLARGRVQILPFHDVAHQAKALIAELERLRQRDPGLTWSRCAVIAREWRGLDVVRAACEARGIPVQTAREARRTLPFHRVREIDAFLGALKADRQRAVRAGELLETLPTGDANPIHRVLRDALGQWRDESGDHELPADRAIEFLYELFGDGDFTPRLGEGVYLTTAHSAKGLEFDHLFIVEGGWQHDLKQGGAEAVESERRLYYVAMTRARQTLALFAAPGHPHLPSAGDETLLEREDPATVDLPADRLNLRYARLGLRELHLGYAARYSPGHPTHAALAALQPGSPLHATLDRGTVTLTTPAGHPVARLSKAAGERWRPRLPAIQAIHVTALLRWNRRLGDPNYTYRCDEWEVPLVEIVWRA
ncbi:RecQ family ATP-dependent DNA helicase [Endothiovibrio diazotrophicus]